MREDRPSPVEIRESLRWLGHEPELVRSPQLLDFLNYIVETTLRGEASRLKAYAIATDVFRRGVSFDPQKDSIVRVQAGRLRKTLDLLYARGVPGATVRIVIPVGRYVPRFEQMEEKAPYRSLLKRFKTGISIDRIVKTLRDDGWTILVTAIALVLMFVLATAVVLFTRN